MTTINEEVINDIRKKSDIVEVISKYVALTPKGKNYFGICPFHSDHSPSMSVSPDKQIYTCFSCGATGNVFTFISEYEHINFIAAVKLLGSKVGYNLDVGNKQVTTHNKDLEVYDLSAKFYQNNINTALGKNALKYLEDRKIDKETIKKFGIGLSIPKISLTSYLEQKNIPLSKLIELGLTNQAGSDIFTNRIIFPLCDLQGNIVGFSGRIYNTKDTSKYVNSKETPLFKKGHLLYNYHRARTYLKKNDYIIIMEGFMDVIRASSVGINNCVATMGTAFTKEQANIVRKMTDNIILCFDGDDAGEEATISAVKLLETMQISPKIIRLEEYKDPDEYIINKGRDAFMALVDNPLSVIDYKMRKLKQNKNLRSIQDLSTYLDEAIQELAKSDDEIMINLTLNKMVAEYHIDYDVLKKKLDKYKALTSTKTRPGGPIIRKDNHKLKQYEQAERSLIYYMLKDESVIHIVEKQVSYFPTADIRALSNEIIGYYHKFGKVNLADFISYISTNSELFQLLQLVISMEDKPEYNKDEISPLEINDYIKSINEYVKKCQADSLEQQLKLTTDPDKQIDILNEILKIKGVKCHVK